MTRVLANTTPARGHLYPIVPALLELQRRGHSVAVRTLASQVGRMRALELDAGPIDPRLEALAHDDFKGRTPLDKVGRSGHRGGVGAPVGAVDPVPHPAALERRATVGTRPEAPTRGSRRGTRSNRGRTDRA